MSGIENGHHLQKMGYRSCRCIRQTDWIITLISVMESHFVVYYIFHNVFWLNVLKQQEESILGFISRASFLYKIISTYKMPPKMGTQIFIDYQLENIRFTMHFSFVSLEYPKRQPRIVYSVCISSTKNKKNEKMLMKVHKETFLNRITWLANNYYILLRMIIRAAIKLYVVPHSRDYLRADSFNLWRNTYIRRALQIGTWARDGDGAHTVLRFEWKIRTAKTFPREKVGKEHLLAFDMPGQKLTRSKTALSHKHTHTNESY